MLIPHSYCCNTLLQTEHVGAPNWIALKLAVVMCAAESAAVTQSAAQTNELKTALYAVTRLRCWQLVKY